MDFLFSAVPLFLLGTGIFFIIRLKGFCFLHPIRTYRTLFEKRRTDGISPAGALTVALAGTLGVGNIVGVASALYLGGPGAVFWMVVSALIAMILKYAEITLAVRHRRHDREGHPYGGAPYYMKDGLAARGVPRLGRWLGGIFALACIINAITMGSILQINAVAGAMEEAFGIPLWAVGGILAVFCTAVMLGGARRIAALTEKAVPLMTIGFLALCAAVLILRRHRIPDAVASIFTDAFRASSVGGGVIGFLLSGGMRYGVMRGLMSNEAGCGTAPMAHASADTPFPAAQGVWGLVEVFVDTVLLCTVTALTILVSDSGPNAFGEDSVRTAQAAFSSVLGGWAGGLFALSIFMFGVATVICWSHYGMTCVRVLTERPWGKWVYTAGFAASVLYGAVAAPSGVWTMADLALAVMTILNLCILWMMHREIARETDRLMRSPSHSEPHNIQ